MELRQKTIEKRQKFVQEIFGFHVLNFVKLRRIFCTTLSRNFTFLHNPKLSQIHREIFPRKIQSDSARFSPSLQSSAGFFVVQ